MVVAVHVNQVSLTSIDNTTFFIISDKMVELLVAPDQGRPPKRRLKRTE